MTVVRVRLTALRGHLVTKHTAGGLTLIGETKVDFFLLSLLSDLKLYAQCCYRKIKLLLLFVFYILWPSQIRSYIGVLLSGLLSFGTAYLRTEGMQIQ